MLNSCFRVQAKFGHSMMGRTCQMHSSTDKKVNAIYKGACQLSISCYPQADFTSKTRTYRTLCNDDLSVKGAGNLLKSCALS